MKKSDKILLEKLCNLLIIIIAGYLLYCIFFKRKNIEGVSSSPQGDTRETFKETLLI